MVLTAAIFAGGLEAAATSEPSEPGWKRALSIRSEALNRIHHLGDFEPAWTRALRVRGEAMNR
jgi:hypothetical protein